MKTKSANKPLPHFTEEDKNRFWEKVDKNGPLPKELPEIGPCWLWTGKARHYFGYGDVTLRGYKSRSHRISWILENGPIPEKMSVLHKCDNTSCCNPAHLFLGDQKDNALDMWKKNRGSCGFGENHAKAKLTIEAVKEVRILIQQGFTMREIGKIFGVDHTQIVRINTGQRWKSVI